MYNKPKRNTNPRRGWVRGRHASWRYLDPCATQNLELWPHGPSGLGVHSVAIVFVLRSKFSVHISLCSVAVSHRELGPLPLAVRDNVLVVHPKPQHPAANTLPSALVLRFRTQTRRGLATLGSDVQKVKHDLASVRASVEECHAENMEFFKSFMGSIEATQQGIDVSRVRAIRIFPQPALVIFISWRNSYLLRCIFAQIFRSETQHRVAFSNFSFSNFRQVRNEDSPLLGPQ